MIKVTQSALRRLKTLVFEHPEDPIVRVGLTDVDEHHLTFSITLEDQIRPEDEIQEIDGLTVAVDGSSRARMDGITMDYQEPDGFKFHHPESKEDFRLNLINLN